MLFCIGAFLVLLSQVDTAAVVATAVMVAVAAAAAAAAAVVAMAAARWRHVTRR